MVGRIGAAAGAPPGSPEAPNQVTFNEYLPGQGISQHIDTRAAFGAAICSLTLGSDIVMALQARAEDVSRPQDRALLAAEQRALAPPDEERGTGDCGGSGGGGGGGSGPRGARGGDEEARRVVAEATALGEAAVAALPPMETPAGSGLQTAVLLPRRSLLVLAGEARHAWRHGIAARRTDVVGGGTVARERRVSLTVRRVRDAPLAMGEPSAADAPPLTLHSAALAAPAACEKAPHPSVPGAAGAAAGAARDASASVPVRASPAAAMLRGGPGDGAAAPAGGAGTPDIERRFVRAFYDAAAPHFAATRHSPWPRVTSFLSALASGSLVADVGCGNGKYSVAAPPGVLLVGCDACQGLVEIAAERGALAVAGDAVRCPFPSGRFDGALSIAVLHHLSTEERRRSAVAEVARVLRPGGAALLQAWARAQAPTSKRQFGTADELVPWRLAGRFASKASTDAVDSCRRGGVPAVPEGPSASAPKAVVLDRYCHLFEEGEVAGLARGCGLDVIEEWWEAGNWCCVAVRPAYGTALPAWATPGRAPSLRAEAAGQGVDVDGPPARR